MLTITNNDDLFFIFKERAKTFNYNYTPQELYLLENFFEDLDIESLEGDLFEFLDNLIINNISFIYKKDNTSYYHKLKNDEDCNFYLIKNEEAGIILIIR